MILFLIGERLRTVDIQRDGGVLVHKSLKTHVKTHKTNDILAIIAGGFEYRAKMCYIGSQ